MVYSKQEEAYRLHEIYHNEFPSDVLSLIHI